MITFIHILGPVATLLFLVGAIVIHKRIRNNSTRTLLACGVIIFFTELISHYFVLSAQYSFAEEAMMEKSMRSQISLMSINGYAHVAAFICYACTLIWISPPATCASVTNPATNRIPSRANTLSITSATSGSSLGSKPTSTKVTCEPNR